MPDSLTLLIAKTDIPPFGLVSFLLALLFFLVFPCPPIVVRYKLCMYVTLYVEEKTSPLGGAFTCLRENTHGLQREREGLTSCYIFNKIKVSNSADVSFDFVSHETDFLINAHFRTKLATLLKKRNNKFRK